MPSQANERFDRFGGIGLPEYETALRGHAQMLGVTRPAFEGSVASVEVTVLRADGLGLAPGDAVPVATGGVRDTADNRNGQPWGPVTVVA